MLYAKIVEGSFMKHRFLEFLKGLIDRMEQSIRLSSRAEVGSKPLAHLDRYEADV
jgi:hypothetical protein